MANQSIFATIGRRPEFGQTEDPAKSASNAVKLANWGDEAASQKAEISQEKLVANEAVVDAQLDDAEQKVEALDQGADFDLREILEGWFDKQTIRRADQQVADRSKVRLTVDSAATYGTMSDAVVRQFVNSAATKASGDAKLAVANVLDQATGVARGIASDKDVNAKNIETQAQKILDQWDNMKMIAFLFGNLYTKVLNRVSSHQNRLEKIMENLGEKAVLLDSVSASLMARGELVLNSLFDTCVSGLALENIIESESKILAQMEKEAASVTASARGPRSILLTNQRDLVSILEKRLIDLKGFAVREEAFYGILSTTHNSVAVIREDVEFTRTNLIAMLGIQLGLVCDIVATLRISESAKNVRQADREAAEQVGVATEALGKAVRDTLTNVDDAMAALEVTIAAAIRGNENSKENFALMQALVLKTDAKLAELHTQLGNS